MADNPLLDLYAAPPVEDKPKSNPLVSLYSEGLVPQPQGPGRPGSHENPILIQRAQGEINPLAGLYSAGEGPMPKQGQTVQPPQESSPAKAAIAIGQVVAPEITKAVTQGMTQPPGEMPEQGKIPEVERDYGPVAVEAISMLPGPEVALGGKAAMVAAAAAKQEDIFKGALAVKNILSPSSTVLGKEATTALRKATGEAARTTEQTRAALIPYDKAVQTMAPPQRLELLGYMEGRSKGAQFPTNVHPALQGFADQFRKEMEKRKNAIIAAGIEAGVIEDYVTHFWQDRNAARAFVKNFMAKQGSGASLKTRKLPTIADGIAAGLTPLTDNPTEIAMRYVTSMDRHLALRGMLDAAEAAGHVRYFSLKDIRDVPDGWVALGGMADKVGSKAYAPADWARIWNNFVSRGLRQNPDVGDAYDAFRNASNLTTQTILSFSGYHAVAMAKEAIASDLVKGIGQIAGGLRRGEADTVLRGIGTMGKVATGILPPILKYQSGKKLREVYLGRATNAIDPRDLPNWAKMADIYGEAGGRGVGKEHAFDYSFTPAGSFATAWKRGWMKAELRRAPGTFSSAFRDAAQKVIAAGEGRKAAAKAGAKAMQTARSIAEISSRTMSTVMAPLFEKYIPMLKNGAFADEFASWLKMNPNATHEQQVQYASKLIDSIDNRFGEMIQDNIMWHTTAKQLATVGMLSYSWNLGSFRLMAGGGKDIVRSVGRALDPTSEHYSPNAAWIIAYPMAVATAAAIYQFLKTGKPPQKPMDLVFPETGGQVPGFGQRGQVPQLAILPGYEKEPWGWVYNGIVNEAINKANPFARMLMQSLLNTDWKGDPIRRPDPTVPEWLYDTFNYAIGSMIPITLGRIGQGEVQGSAMGLGEQLTGIRQAPVSAQDPEGYARGMSAIETNKWLKKLKYDFKHDVFGDHNTEKARAIYAAKIRAARERQSQYGGPQQ